MPDMNKDEIVEAKGMNFENFGRSPARCAICRKEKGKHLAVTLHCPVGIKTRVGYVQFSTTECYTPVKKVSNEAKEICL
jgi:hypothetical protein